MGNTDFRIEKAYCALVGIITELVLIEQWSNVKVPHLAVQGVSKEFVLIAK